MLVRGWACGQSPETSISCMGQNSEAKAVNFIIPGRYLDD